MICNDCGHVGEMVLIDSSPALQAELTEQKEHFVVALTALRAQAERDKLPVPLTLEQLMERNRQPIWIEGSEKRFSGWSVFLKKHEKQIASCPDDCNITYYLKDYGVRWFAYDRPPERGA